MIILWSYIKDNAPLINTIILSIGLFYNYHHNSYLIFLVMLISFLRKEWLFIAIIQMTLFKITIPLFELYDISQVIYYLLINTGATYVISIMLFLIQLKWAQWASNKSKKIFFIAPIEVNNKWIWLVYKTPVYSSGKILEVLYYKTFGKTI